MYNCPCCECTFKLPHFLQSHYSQKHAGDILIEHPEHISFEELGAPSRRKLLLNEARHKCSQCGYDKCRDDGKTILEIDHIDGNPQNNKRENLRVLCPNCHALTPTFRNHKK